MIFNITYDASVTAAQQTAVNAIVQVFEHHYIDNATVNITVSFADLSATNGLGASTYQLNTYNYSDIRTNLATDQTTTDDAAGALPATDPISGTHTYWVSRAEAKAIGLLAPSTAADGTVTFHNGAGGYGFDFNRADGITAGQYDFAGTVAHELTEVMGRALLVNGTIGTTANSYYLYDLYHYSAAGTRTFSGTTAGYFSLDNGTTNLDDFNTTVGGDFGDWANTTLVGNDSFLAFSSPSVVNAVMQTDFRVMDILGWDLVNQAPTLVALTKSTGEDGPFNQNLLEGTNDADGDFLSVVNLANSLVTANGRTLSLGTDYTLTSGTLTLTAAGLALFNNLAEGASDTALFSFGVTDFLATINNTLTLTINGLNDPPVANPDVGSAGENETKLFDVLANDTDVDTGDMLSLLSLGSVTVSSSNPTINGLALPASALTIDSGQIKFTPGNSFDPLSSTDTATVVASYTMQDNHSATSSSELTLTVNGANDAPVIVSGGGGDAATYFVRVNEKAIATVGATDVDVGDVPTFSIIGGADADRFSIDPNTGELIFDSHPNPPNKSYAVQVQASDGHGGFDTQAITVNVTADKMNGDAAHAVADTFVFHPKFGANTITNFDLDHDFLQFDSGMFPSDTVAAVLAAAQDLQGRLSIDVHAGHLTIVGITSADLAAHASDIIFV